MEALSEIEAIFWPAENEIWNTSNVRCEMVDTINCKTIWSQIHQQFGALCYPDLFFSINELEKNKNDYQVYFLKIKGLI